MHEACAKCLASTKADSLDTKRNTGQTRCLYRRRKRVGHVSRLLEFRFDSGDGGVQHLGFHLGE